MVPFESHACSSGDVAIIPRNGKWRSNRLSVGGRKAKNDGENLYETEKKESRHLFSAQPPLTNGSPNRSVVDVPFTMLKLKNYLPRAAHRLNSSALTTDYPKDSYRRASSSFYRYSVVQVSFTVVKLKRISFPGQPILNHRHATSPPNFSHRPR